MFFCYGYSYGIFVLVILHIICFSNHVRQSLYDISLSPSWLRWFPIPLKIHSGALHFAMCAWWSAKSSTCPHLSHGIFNCAMNFLSTTLGCSLDFSSRHYGQFWTPSVHSLHTIAPQSMHALGSSLISRQTMHSYMSKLFCNYAGAPGVKFTGSVFFSSSDWFFSWARPDGSRFSTR